MSLLYADSFFAQKCCDLATGHSATILPKTKVLLLERSSPILSVKTSLRQVQVTIILRLLQKATEPQDCEYAL